MKELTNEDKLKCELEEYKLSLKCAIEHLMCERPFPIDYKNGDVEDIWDEDKWMAWYKSKGWAMFLINKDEQRRNKIARN